jgi:uncharacterized protein (DUF427 family)
MPERKSLYSQYPDYRVDLEPCSKRVQVRLGGQVIADSSNTLLALETKHHPVHYFPPEDVRFEFLTATAHETFCPFKGEASYWTAQVGEVVEEDVVWSYPDPFEEVAGLKGYLSFYLDRVEWSEEA